MTDKIVKASMKSPLQDREMRIRRWEEIFTFRPDPSCIFGLVSTGILEK